MGFRKISLNLAFGKKSMRRLGSPTSHPERTRVIPCRETTFDLRRREASCSRSQSWDRVWVRDASNPVARRESVRSDR